MCMMFYRRDGHVIELQTGSAVSRPEEACSQPYFAQNDTPFLTLVSKYDSLLALLFLSSLRTTFHRSNEKYLEASRL